MSKNINGIMGPQVGKIGTVVGYVANGKMIYRAYQRYVKNPQTPAQQAHRFKLKTLSQASKDLERMLKGNRGQAPVPRQFPAIFFTQIIDRT